MKTAAHILGLILLWACIVGRGRAQKSLSDNEVDQAFSASENSLAALLAGSQQQQQEPAQRRLSLEDFFLNRNAQQQEAAPAALQQLPEAQLQVQQPNPESVVMVRDTNLPVVNGGMLSRLLLARRVLRLRRMMRRMLILPRILRLGNPLRPLRPLRQVAAASPLRLFSNRIGQAYDDPYDPRDYVFGNKGYFDSNIASSQETNYNKNKQKQSFRSYDNIVDPYELPYDQINLEKEKAVNNYEIDEGKYQNWNKQTLNDVNVDSYSNNQAYDIQKIQDQLQLLQKLQQQNQAVSNYEENDKRPKYKSSQKNQPSNSQDYQDSPQVEYESNHEEYENPTDHKYDSQSNQQEQSNNYKQTSQAKQVDEQQLQLTREQILQLLREQQLQILRDEQLKLQQLQQLQLLQQQQGQGYRQPQQYDNQHSNAESEDQDHDYQEEPYEHQHQNPEKDEQHGHSNGHEAEDGEYEKSQTVGTGLSSAKSQKAGGKAIGVGVNVAIKPPAVNIEVTKPVSPVIKPIPPIVNPIIHKPVASAPVEEALVPIGFLPKPILKLNGRLFFGAEAGKGVTIG